MDHPRGLTCKDGGARGIETKTVGTLIEDGTNQTDDVDELKPERSPENVAVTRVFETKVRTSSTQVTAGDDNEGKLPVGLGLPGKHPGPKGKVPPPGPPGQAAGGSPGAARKPKMRVPKLAPVDASQECVLD